MVPPVRLVLHVANLLWAIRQHGLGLFLRRGCQGGGGLMAIRHSGWRRSCSSYRRSGASFIFLFFQFVLLQIHPCWCHRTWHFLVITETDYKELRLTSGYSNELFVQLKKRQLLTFFFFNLNVLGHLKEVLLKKLFTITKVCELLHIFFFL